MRYYYYTLSSRIYFPISEDVHLKSIVEQKLAAEYSDVDWEELSDLGICINEHDILPSRLLSGVNLKIAPPCVLHD